MIISAGLNKKLYKMFQKSFKNELMYYNRSGMFHYILQNYPFSTSNNNQVHLDDVYLEDFERYLDRYPERSSININLKSDDSFVLNKVKTQIENLYEEFNDENKKNGNALAFNYMIFHLLVNAGFIELKEKDINYNEVYSFDSPINNPEGYFDEERIYLE